MPLLFYHSKRFLKRILWKFFPRSDDQYLKKLERHLAKGQYPEVADIDETIDKLFSGKYSIARFGDGEYNLCYDRSIAFQKADKRLRKRLRQILKSDPGNKCLIAIPAFHTEKLSPFWIRYWYENYDDIIALFRKDGAHYYQSNSREYSIEQIIHLQPLWINRFVVFICGEGSRFDYKHEIFSQVNGYSVICGLPLNAWFEYKKLFEESCIELSKHNNPLVIISLGPTATVLAYDLCQLGYQAIDIGHITNMYDELVYGKAKPEKLPFIHKK
jgi:glycosyltransferase family protein